jgi:hypothetical protein
MHCESSASNVSVYRAAFQRDRSIAAMGLIGESQRVEPLRHCKWAEQAKRVEKGKLTILDSIVIVDRLHLYGIHHDILSLLAMCLVAVLDFRRRHPRHDTYASVSDRRS